MIQNDQELKVTRERISYLLDLLARLRVSSRPEELALVAGGYRAEVKRMQREVLDYLMQPASQTAKGTIQPGRVHQGQRLSNPRDCLSLFECPAPRGSFLPHILSGLSRGVPS